MMSTILITLNLACPATVVNNQSSQAWQNNDNKIMNQYNRRCLKDFAQSPCLKTFSKTGPQSYQALCGGQAKTTAKNNFQSTLK